ncbi:Ycf48-like protein [Planctomycetes bacterium Poly30]|uniref:Ycf48-like protein n=1 Tax=Saltatorellus ferox TaxID=2528018 RepID=A0A518ENC5_9BACT|nr:Ycf48-like protein [Planctomycetes bacterium Poly30]
MLISLFVSTFAAALALPSPQEASAPTAPASPVAATPASVLKGMEFREVGPYRGGRSAAVTGLDSDPMTYYMGAAGGGVWKTTNGGQSWKNISDGTFGGSIGAVAVSEWDPNVIYVGGGEKTVRGNVAHGDGLWRSEDAGRTWKSIGLEDSHHVPRIRIHPRDPDTAWAAVLGHLYGPHPTRGVYKTTDGGETWEQKLFVSEDAGCVDLALDPSNPRVMFASFWNVRRTPYSLSSGGEGSSLWKSVDGGETWTDISANDGMPEGPLGISGISVSGADSDTVYAVIEAKEGGVFRSRDGGKKWSRVSSDRNLRQRAWYYSRLQADPVDVDTVYVLNVGMHRSTDGGKTFDRISTPHSDNHDLWIAPSDPKRMIESNDGGANISFDGGESWSEQDTQPTSQMYRVSIDTAQPYRLLGGQQDNSALRIRSSSERGGRPGLRDWESTAGGESGHVVAHPANPDLVFGGSYGGYLTMRDHANGQSRNVTVWPDNPMGYGAEGMLYRFQWNFPLFFSPHGDPEAALDSDDSYALYAGSNVLFRSTDLGASWKQISPDLTRNDPTRLGPSGGPITKDNTGVEYYCTIFAAFESPLRKGVIWCGSDDGRVHVTTDDGGTWNDVTPEGLPEWTQINDMIADPFAVGGAYLAGTRYKLDDFKPYVYHTTDFGATWQDLSAGIPEDHFTRAIEADPERRGLLFAGTERGLYVSMNGGEEWSAFQQGLPIVPVTDLQIAGSDLVAATQGRGYWILDDIASLRQLSLDAHFGNSVLYAPDDVTRASYDRGVAIDYLVAEGVEDLKLTIKDYDGEVIAEFVPKGKGKKNPHAAEKDDVLPNDVGFHRFTWNLRAKGAESFPDMILWSGGMGGPKVPPGLYRIELTVDGETVAVPLTLTADPRSTSSTMDLVSQYQFVVETGEWLTRAHTAIRNIRSVSKDLGALKKRLPEPAEGEEADAAVVALKAEIDAALDGMKAVEEALYQTKNQSGQDPLNFPIQLTDKLAGVRSGAMQGEFAPTAQMWVVADELMGKIETEVTKVEALMATAIPAIDEKARGMALPLVSVPD